MGVSAASRGYFGSTRPRASSVANSSSSTSLSTRSRILACNADLGIARIWKASATESSGGTPLGEESINAVPARFARSRFVVSGTTRIDWRTRVSVSLCKITTGRRPVCSRGRYAPRSAHQSSPRFNSAPLSRARWPLRQTLLGKGKVFRTADLRKLGQIPAASNRAPNHDQVHTLTGSEAQPVHRQEYAILVTGFHQSHDLNRTTPAHAGRTAKPGAGRAAAARIGGGFPQPGGPVAALPGIPRKVRGTRDAPDRRGGQWLERRQRAPRHRFP